MINTGPYSLDIRRVFLFSVSNGEPKSGVVVDHPCAVTFLQDVFISNFRGFGIYHRGGSLVLVGTRVVSTQTHTELPSQGTGILLTCGVRASMFNVFLIANESSGLLMSGEGTYAKASFLQVTGTRVHPLLFISGNLDGNGGWGAVHVRDGALLEATFFNISRNLLVGIFVDSEGEARLQAGMIADTRSVVPPPPVGPAGMGAVALRGGHLSLTHFVVIRAELCEIFVALAGLIELSNGEVAENEIGACINVRGYPLHLLLDEVVYRDNRALRGTSGVPNPMPGEPPDIRP